MPYSPQQPDLTADTLYFDADESFSSVPSPQKKTRVTRNKLKQAGIELPSTTRSISTRTSGLYSIPQNVVSSPRSISESPASSSTTLLNETPRPRSSRREYQENYRESRSTHLLCRDLEKRLESKTALSTVNVEERHNVDMVDEFTTDQTMDELNTAVIDEPMNVFDTADELFYFERQQVCYKFVIITRMNIVLRNELLMCNQFKTKKRLYNVFHKEINRLKRLYP
jgi:hypothetical protein